MQLNHRKVLSAISVLTLVAGRTDVALAGQDGSGLKTEYEGENWSLVVGGRLQVDFVDAETDNVNVDFRDEEIRRARLRISGKIGEQLKYKAEVNSDNDGEVTFTSAYLDWSPRDRPFIIRAGQFKTPNSLDEQTSSRFSSTLERSAYTDAFGFKRRLGIGIIAESDKFTFSAGVFEDNLEVSSNETSYAFAARGTWSPINTKERVFHLGASIRQRELRDSASLLRYRQRPFAHIPGRIISTGRIATSDTFIGLETAGIYGRFWGAAEYGHLSADCSACASDPDFNGAYIEGGAFFGGRKTYKKEAFARPQVDRPVDKGGSGAFLAVIRYDTIDLNDTSVQGGDYDAFIIGLDWWPTSHTRASINYFDVDAGLGTSTSGLDPVFAGLVTLNAIGEDLSGFMARLQFDF